MITELIYYLSDNYLFFPFVGVFLVSVFVTLKSGFIQFRTIPLMFKMLLQNQGSLTNNDQTVSPRTALFIAMSTSIGMGNIVGPVVALGMGGPAALAGFVFAAIFGAAITFCEVNLALQFRQKNSDGSFSGGPMYYLKQIFGSTVAQFYAWAGLALLTAWSANQANSLALQFSLQGVPVYLSGLVVAVAVVVILIGGIKRIGQLNDMLVPIMFLFYAGGTSWIIFLNRAQLLPNLSLIFGSLFSLKALGGAMFGFGLQNAFRWGFAKGTQASEAGVGTATFPHSASQLNDPFGQGVLAMVSVFTTAFLCLLSGLTVMCSGAWLDPSAQFDVRMFAGVVEQFFPFFGKFGFTLCAFLFSFGTILGNCYNASQCFIYVADRKYLSWFYLVAAVAVFFGSISEVKFLWTVVDFFMLPVVIPNVLAILIMVLNNKIQFNYNFLKHY